MVSYTPTVWASGDVITAAKLSNAETGINNDANAANDLDTHRVMNY